MKNALFNLKNKIPTFFNKEEGATMVEYAIMVALIAIVSIVVITNLGESVSSTFNRVDTAIRNAG